MAYRMAANKAAMTRDHTDAPVEIRQIGVQDLFDSLSLGVQDFLAAPTQLLFLGLIYPIVGAVAAAAVNRADLVPLLYPMLAGISIMGPLAALGIYELSRQREMGVEVSWRNALDVRHSPALSSIAWLGVMLLGLFILWLAAAEQIYLATLASAPHAGPVEFMTSLLSTREGWMMIIIGNGVGLLFAVTVLTLTVVSFPLLLDRHGGVAHAIATSVRAVRHNPGMMLLWGLIVACLLLLGSLPLFVGLAVVVPILGHATWHLYRRVIG